MINIKQNQRLFRRYLLEVKFSVRIKDVTYQGVTVDYSLYGLGVFIYGHPPLSLGQVLLLDIDRLGIHQKGRVAWLDKADAGVTVGLLKLDTLRGSLRDYSLADILLGLQRTLKSGTLSITSPKAVKKVYIDQGDIIFATSTADEDRLGDVLLQERLLTEEQYVLAGKAKKETKERYAGILVRLGFIRPRDLKRVVRLQAQRTLERLFPTHDATFEFDEGSLPAGEVIRLHLSAADLIYKDMKRSAADVLLQACPSERVVDFSPDPATLFQHIRLAREDRKIISYVDGKTSIMDILRLSPLGEEDTLRCLYALLEIGIVVLKEEGEPSLGISYEEILEIQERRLSHLTIERINEVYESCERLGHYRILGLENSATAKEIKKAYYQAAKQFHPDLHFSLPEDMKEKLNYIFTRINAAYAVLKNESTRREYDRSTSAKTKRVPRGTEMGARNFQEGIGFFRSGQFEDAERLFAQAAYFDGSNVQYLYYYGLALSELGRVKEAARVLEKALHLDAHNADVLAELGHLFLKLDFRLRAQSCFEKAIGVAPSHRRAAEGLRNLESTGRFTPLKDA
ncbi:MAG: DnaJ domain-containing protein [Nitrospiraceae bacterium]|nr:DnaJ domain-containing protein [Nitrospiraceae bacterium]